jgi:hypothetical protein
VARALSAARTEVAARVSAAPAAAARAAAICGGRGLAAWLRERPRGARSPGREGHRGAAKAG